MPVSTANPDPNQIVAVLGLGSMGMGMATSLLRAGFHVRGFDVSAARAEAFRAAGGEVAASPAEAARDAGFAVAVVVNAAQTEAVLFGADGCADTMAAGGCFISCATMAPDMARALAARLDGKGRHYLDAPMSGGSVRAADGTLTMMLSGAPDVVAQARPGPRQQTLTGEETPGTAWRDVPGSAISQIEAEDVDAPVALWHWAVDAAGSAQLG